VKVQSDPRQRDRRLGLLAFAVLTLVLFQFGVPLRASHRSWTTGDEPFYLLTAASLAGDSDLDLRNQYASSAYRAFFDHPQALWHQAVPAPDGRQRTPHNAGLPVLLAPTYALGGAVLAKRFMALLAVAMLAIVFLVARRLTGRSDASLVAAAGLAISAPVFVYATQIYPEMPAALVIAGMIWLVFNDQMRWFPRVTLLAVGLIALPWLGAKYALIGAVVAPFVLFRLGRWGAALLIALLLIGGAHYVWFHLSRYGGLTPYAVNFIYAGNNTASVIGLHLEIWSRLYRVLGLLVDREFGLIRWAPLLLLALPGSVIAVRRLGWRGWLLIAIVAAQLIVAVFLSITMRGWWFPGRMLVAVLPVMGIWLATTLDSIRDYRFWLAAGGLAGISGWTTVALWEETAARLVTLAVDPFLLSAAVFRWPAVAFPLYTAYGLDTWILSGLWLAALIGFVVAVVRLAARRAAGTIAVRNGMVSHLGREECRV